MTNKSIFAVILIALFLFAGGIKSQNFSYTYQGNTLYYDSTSSNTVSVVFNPNGKYAGDIVIPSQITYNDTTYSVTSIANLAFASCDSLTNVTIPSSVTSIGDGAFRDCQSLTSITIPNSVTSIGVSVFFKL